jgi:hypothetical protein
MLGWLFLDMLGTKPLNPRQRELLLVMAKARCTTLLRWPFYLKLSPDGLADSLGHPDLYGHEIAVRREDIYRLAEFGFLKRVADGSTGFMDDFFVTSVGIRFYRRSALWQRIRLPLCYACVVVPVSLAILAFLT